MILVKKFPLPPLYLITPEPENLDKFLLELQAALSSGIKLIQLRAKDLAKKDASLLITKSLQLSHSFSAKLLLNSDLAAVSGLSADGTHLTSKKLLSLRKRPCGREYLVAASCHNELELHHAAKIGVDFATLSPILATTSHPESVPLEWENLARMAALVGIPIYALGGMSLEHVALSKQNGAIGIAAISSLWNRPLSI